MCKKSKNEVAAYMNQTGPKIVKAFVKSLRTLADDLECGRRDLVDQNFWEKLDHGIDKISTFDISIQASGNLTEAFYTKTTLAECHGLSEEGNEA